MNQASEIGRGRGAAGEAGIGLPAPGLERLGRYQLCREIGRGFSSVVFEATDLLHRRTVAVKVLTFLQNLSPERRTDLSERFAREARAISALAHPGIVAIYEVGHADDGREFIAMEYLPGESLRTRLQRAGTLAPEEAVSIALQLADALQFAHDRGIIHRDVKPDNVFILPDGRVKLMDFGVAHVLSDEALTQTGTVVGSPAYMSPEQINGEHLDGRSDVFSLGVMLAEMVVGHKPFEAPTIPAVMHRILYRSPQMESVSPRGLRKIIEKALAKNRTMRFQSATALADALRRQVLPGLPVWEPTSTAIMPIPVLLLPHGSRAWASGESLEEPAARPASTGWKRVAALGLTGVVLLSAGLYESSIKNTAPPHVTIVRRLGGAPLAPFGGVRHIPAYWQRGQTAPTAVPQRETQRLPTPPQTRAQHSESIRVADAGGVPADAPLVSIIPTPLSATRAPAPPARPAVPQAPQVARAASPQMARTAASFPSRFTAPMLRPIVVKVADSVQERQAPTPPTIAPPAAQNDQDAEVIAPDGPPRQPRGDGIPDSAPRLVHRTDTLYPRSVPEAQLGGTTTLRVFINEDGDVTGATVAHSSGLPALDDAAVETVKQWEYEPSFRGGQAVAGTATARITFSP